jgi:hypothetical protein
MMPDVPGSAGMTPGAALTGPWSVVADDHQSAGWDWHRTREQVVRMQPGRASLNSLVSPNETGRDIQWQDYVEGDASSDRWGAETRAADDYYFVLAPRLHERPRALHVIADPSRVTIERDGFAEHYRTSSSAEPVERVGPGVKVKTWWSAGTLQQELTGQHGFKARRSFTVSPDGARLSVVTKVLTPRFSPTLETIRGYTRHRRAQ